MKKLFIQIAACCCFIACLGDILSSTILGIYYFPTYNALLEPLSGLGETASPVASIINICWIVFAISFTLFAVGLIISSAHNEAPVKYAAILIILYALGDQLGSALLPGNYEEIMTLHNLVGGVGLLALIAYPIVMRRSFINASQRNMAKFSLIITITGLITFMLFTLSKVIVFEGSIFTWRGFWQRIFTLNYYIYLMVIAYRMIKQAGKENGFTN